MRSQREHLGHQRQCRRVTFFMDHPRILNAATAAGLPTIVVSSEYTADQDFSGAAMVRPGFDGIEPLVAATCQWVHRQWWTVRASDSSQ
jgi:hypothetical protein